MTNRKTLMTGITGQDGSHLAMLDPGQVLKAAAG